MTLFGEKNPKTVNVKGRGRYLSSQKNKGNSDRQLLADAEQC